MYILCPAAGPVAHTPHALTLWPACSWSGCARAHVPRIDTRSPAAGPAPHVGAWAVSDQPV